MSSWTQADVDRIIGKQAAAKRTETPHNERTPKETVNTKPSTAKERTQALGRLPGGVRNKTEAAYERLLQIELGDGLIRWYAFEPWNLRLGDNCFYSPDFGVMAADGTIQVREVKGRWTDDGLAKFKAAAAQHPFRFIAVRMVKGSFETILEI